MAGVSLQAVGQTAASSVQRMPGPQRVTLALAFAATVIGVFLVARSTGNPQMSTLYTELEPSTAAAITGELDAQGVRYELLDGGRVIRVPADRVHELRLDLSAKDLPGSDQGWGILDDQGITASAFDQRVGFQRAMEGELAKTISAIDGVSSAKVHLAIPENDLLLDDGNRPSASVLLVAGGPGAIGPMQVDAIVNLVASSIEGLSADQVSVADDSGRVLAAPGEGSGVVGLEGDTRLRARREFETVMENDLEAMLARVVGPGLAVVEVNAELDFDSVVTVTEEYKPLESADGDQLKSAETTRAEFYRTDNVATEEAGELAVDLPGDIDTDTDGEVDEGVKFVKDEQDVTYLFDKVMTNAENAPGTLTSLSVAVLLDEAAIDAGRLGEIETMVQAAAGIDLGRGDALAVTLMPMNEQVKDSIESANARPVSDEGGGLDLIGLIRMIGTVIVALAVMILGLRYLSRGSNRTIIDSVDLNELEAGSALALEAGAFAEDLGGEENHEPAELKLQSLIANQTDDVAGVLRSWLNEAEEVAR